MTTPVPARTSGGVRVARVVLIGVGVVLLVVAAWLLGAEVRPRQYPGILLWLAAAVVLHDGVFAPIVLIGTRLLRRVGARVSWGAIAVVQVALVVGGAITAIAIPGIRARQLGARNPSVLVFDYAAHLAVAWGVIAVLAAVVVLAISLRRRHD